MSAVLTPSSHHAGAQPPVSTVRAIPMAVWAVIGTLALATAGLTGALVMRSVDSGPAAPATQVAAVTVPASPVQSQGQAATVQPLAEAPAAKVQAATGSPVAQLAPEPQAAARPAAKPAVPARPKPQPVAAQQPAPAPVERTAQPQPLETTRAAICNSCGTIESVHAVQEQGQGSGLGAVAGAVAGGLLGNQVGGGNGKKAMTVLGAAGGAFAGHEVEKRARATTAYDVRVRMEDGSVRHFRRAEPMAVGTRVVTDGQSLRASSQGGTAARAIHTVAPAGNGI